MFADIYKTKFLVRLWPEFLHCQEINWCGINVDEADYINMLLNHSLEYSCT